MIKYILIPEYRPLYAMRYCYGPEHGPLTKPCPTPLDVIGKLLLQSGSEQVSIYEVKYDPVTRTTGGEPVRLTLENYRLPYDQIAGNVNIPVAETVVAVPVKEVKTVKPVIIEKLEEEEPSVTTEPVEEEVQEEESEPITTTVTEVTVTALTEEVTVEKTILPEEQKEEEVESITETEEIPSDVVVTEEASEESKEESKVEETPVEEQPKERTPRMTKAQRREFRRQLQKAQQEAKKESSETQE